RVVRYGFGHSLPILFFASPIRFGCHHAGNRLRESIVHRGYWLLPAANALDPIGHMLDRQVVDGHRRQFLFAWAQEVFSSASFVDIRTFFVIAFFFDQLIAWT